MKTWHKIIIVIILIFCTIMCTYNAIIFTEKVNADCEVIVDKSNFESDLEKINNETDISDSNLDLEKENTQSKTHYESATNTLNSDLKELVSMVGDVQRSDLIDKSEHLKVWYIYQNGDIYIITIHNGQLDQKIQLN